MIALVVVALAVVALVVVVLVVAAVIVAVGVVLSVGVVEALVGPAPAGVALVVAEIDSHSVSVVASAWLA